MFVGDEVLLDVGLAVAWARLANLARSGMLRGASEDAYGTGIAGPPDAAAAGRGRLARVHVRELAESDDSAGLAIRWEVAGPGGGLFPVLDADIKLTPAADRTTVLALAGVYRPPHAADEAPEPAILRRMASAAIRNFLGRLAADITGQHGPAASRAGPSPVTRPRETPQPPPNV
jgi:hypothetical protein